MRLGGVRKPTVLALIIGAMSACGSMPASLSPSAQPSQTPTANVAALLNAKAEAACLTNVPVWPEAPRAECQQVYQSTPTMLIMQADVILQGVTPRSEADASTHALVAHGWVLKRSTLNDQDEQRWLELSTPAHQCLEVGALTLIRPGLMGVDLSVVYDYLFGSGPCPTN
jgi:hypothetical protein